MPLEQARWGETPEPQDKLPRVPREEPPPHEEPAGAGNLSTAEEEPPEERPVHLELLRPSPGRSRERELLTPEPSQVCKKQSRCPQHRGNMTVSKLVEAFEDVAVYFTREEWELLETGDKGLYQDQMLRNYRALVSLGYQGPTPDLICRIQQGEMELWICDEEAGENLFSEDLTPADAESLGRDEQQQQHHEEEPANLNLFQTRNQLPSQQEERPVETKRSREGFEGQRDLRFDAYFCSIIT
ncbi:hypothetical protein Y1Q_0006797 [Alligator mississippiensis]|uniref:Uncharacterized protein n=1 Tax=Alligator mississippiensis TaxID=8496 RepID=A0A151M5N5_ALLMI|nr:hypothetical protein Y1Q_0006797 [Alligator mississippiensis]